MQHKLKWPGCPGLTNKEKNMYIILIDGAHHKGSSKNIVKSMARRDHETQNPDNYMQLVRARVKEVHRIEINFMNEMGFLTELQRVGLIYKMEEDET